METIVQTVITGGAIPFLASLLNRQHWSAQIKVYVVVVLCIIFGAVQQYFAGALAVNLHDGQILLAVIIGILTVSQGIFKVFKGKLDQIETNVNVLPDFAGKTIDATPTAQTFSIDDLKDVAIAAAKDAAVAAITNKAKDLLPETKTYTGAGTAGAVPSEPQAQLGGPDIPVNPMSETLYAKNATPLITPAPSVKAEAEAIAAAISAGIPVESIANNIETKAPGGSE